MARRGTRRLALAGMSGIVATVVMTRVKHHCSVRVQCAGVGPAQCSQLLSWTYDSIASPGPLNKTPSGLKRPMYPSYAHTSASFRKLLHNIAGRVRNQMETTTKIDQQCFVGQKVMWMCHTQNFNTLSGRDFTRWKTVHTFTSSETLSTNANQTKIRATTAQDHPPSLPISQLLSSLAAC